MVGGLSRRRTVGAVGTSDAGMYLGQLRFASDAGMYRGQAYI